MKLCRLSLISLSIMVLSGCFDKLHKAYQQDLDKVLQAEIVCAEESVVTLESYDRDGSLISKVTAPGASICGDLPTPRHPLDAAAPIITAGIGGLTSVLVAYIDDRGDRKVARINADLRRDISNNELAERLALYEELGGIVETNQDLTQQLIDATALEEEPVMEDSNEVGELLAPDEEPVME